MFLNTAGDLLDAEQERRRCSGFIEDGNGFLGIGSAADGRAGLELLQRPDRRAARRTTARRRRRSRPSSPATACIPSTRDLPLQWNRTDVWYTWQTRPTGTVHTVARYRAPTRAGRRRHRPSAAPTPDLLVPRLPRRPLLLHRHGPHRGGVRRGRLQARTCSARSQWTAGLVRGDCKATINANYKGTKLISAGADGHRASPPAASRTASSIAPNGWVIYIGRGDCRTDAERGALLGLPPFGAHPRPRRPERRHRLRQRAHLRPGAVHRRREQRRHARRQARGLRRRRHRAASAPTRPTTRWSTACSASPPRRTSRTTGHIYLQYFPTFNPRQHAARACAVDRRISKMSRPRISRFTINLADQEARPRAPRS